MDPPEPDLPRTRRLITRMPGLVWAVPLAALLVVGYLGIHAWAERGVIVTVTFRSAADARPHDTKVLYQGVEAGELIKIVPNEDGRRLDFKLRLIPAAKPGLNTNARFWLIGGSPNLSDISSLKSLVSGVAIGYAPGDGGEPTDTFEGLEEAPLVLPGDQGTRYRLSARMLGSIHRGSIVLFHGQGVGKVIEQTFKGEAGFELEIFIFQPYDALIKPDTRFWRLTPLRLSLAGGGLNASLAPFSALLAGGIDLELPAADADTKQSRAESEFTLYPSRDAARAGLSGPSVRYDFIFDGTAGSLDESAGVTLLGFQIGQVEKVRLIFDAKTGQPLSQVTASLYPARLELPVTAKASPAELRSAMDDKLRKMLHLGYRARLEQSPPLLGNLSIALVQMKGTAAADLAQGENPRIPSVAGGGGLEGVASQANQVLTKINSIPIERIGEDLREVTSRLRSLVASPKLDEGIAHLNSVLGEIDQTLAQVQPQIGPLLTKLNEAASQLADTASAAQQLLGSESGGQGEGLADAVRQLTQAARSVQSLADYLGRHPEALIRGKRAAP
jgi:paraquat-inducible protein B